MPWNYVHVASIQGGSGRQVLTGPAHLNTVLVNTKGSGGNTVTLFDSAGSGTCTTIGIIDSTASVMGGFDLAYDILLKRGLLVYSNTGVGPDLTVVYG